jgi:hypothetical protein
MHRSICHYHIVKRLNKWLPGLAVKLHKWPYNEQPEGQPLKEALEEGFNPFEAFRQLVHFIYQMHQTNVVHNNICIENLRVLNGRIILSGYHDALDIKSKQVNHDFKDVCSIFKGFKQQPEYSSEWFVINNELTLKHAIEICEYKIEFPQVSQEPGHYYKQVFTYKNACKYRALSPSNITPFEWDNIHWPLSTSEYYNGYYSLRYIANLFYQRTYQRVLYVLMPCIRVKNAEIEKRIYLLEFCKRYIIESMLSKDEPNVMLIKDRIFMDLDILWNSLIELCSDTEWL